MVSAMVSCAFGLGLEITQAQLSEINKRREGKEYVDTEVAMYIYGNLNISLL